MPLRSVRRCLPGAIVEENSMARTLAELPAGSRITDYISLGVIAKFFPVEKIREVLEQTNRASIRERDLPAHVVVYYVIALALYMRSSYREVLRCLREGVQWLLDPSAKVKVAGKSGISQPPPFRVKEPFRRKDLDGEQAVQPRVSSLVHDTHPALSDLLKNLVVRDGSSDHWPLSIFVGAQNGLTS